MAPRPRATLALAGLWRRWTIYQTWRRATAGRRRWSAIHAVGLHPDARRAGAGASPPLVGLPLGQGTVIATVRRRAGAAAGTRVRPARRGADVRKSDAAGTLARVRTPAPAAGGSFAAAPRSAPVSPVLAACETAAPLASTAAEAAAAAAHAALRVAPVEALKSNKTGGAKAGSVAESLARLSIQRDNEAGEKENAHTVTVLETKVDQEGRLRLPQAKDALEQRRAEEEQRDREQARRQN